MKNLPFLTSLFSQMTDFFNPFKQIFKTFFPVFPQTPKFRGILRSRCQRSWFQDQLGLPPQRALKPGLNPLRGPTWDSSIASTRFYSPDTILNWWIDAALRNGRWSNERNDINLMPTWNLLNKSRNDGSGDALSAWVKSECLIATGKLLL